MDITLFSFGPGVCGQLRQSLRMRGSPPEKRITGEPKSARSSMSLTFLCSQFVLIINISGMCITVYTFQVAASGHIPDDNRFFVDTELQKMGREFFRIPAVP